MSKALPEGLPSVSYWQKKWMKALSTIWGWFVMPSSPRKAGQIIDAAYEKYYAMTEPDFDWSREPHDIISLISQCNFWRVSINYNYLVQLTTDMSEEGYHGYHKIYLKQLAIRRGSRLLVAIREYEIEHGVWPASLDEIKSRVPAEAYTDPITGEDFVYDNHGERFSLYCEAANIWPK
jgi:hypothetical protein